VYIHQLGQSDFLGMAKALSRSELFRHLIYLCERHSYHMITSLQDNLSDRLTLILDLAGITARQLANPIYLSLLQEGVKLLLDNYPERLTRCLLVNAPFPNLVKVGWGTIRLVMDNHVASKVMFLLDVDWRQRLLQFVARENLPIALGGNCRDHMIKTPDDNYCAAVLGVGGMVPPEYYLINQDVQLEGQNDEKNRRKSEKLRGDHNVNYVKTEIIPSMTSFKVKVKVTEEMLVGRQVITFRFATVESDIRFGAYYVNYPYSISEEDLR